MVTMVKGLNPENFIKEFEPGSNPFEVTIIRLMNPRAVDIRAMDKPLLVKLLSRIKMRSFSDAHRKAFENLVRAIDVKEMFCGIFTPDVSEIYFDGDVMIVDLTSYLKPGMETKIAKLFQVALDSPRVHEERVPSKELTDRAITDRFLRNVNDGIAIGEALKLAIEQQAQDGSKEPKYGMTAAPPPPLPPPPPPPPQPIARGPKSEPPVVTVSTDPADAIIEDKIAKMEQLQKEREMNEVKDEAGTKGKKPRKTVRRVKKKSSKDAEDGPETVDGPQVPIMPTPVEEKPQTPDPAPQPPAALAPAMDDSSPEGTMAQETVAAVHTEAPIEPEPKMEEPTVVQPVEEKASDPVPTQVVEASSELQKERSAVIPPPPAITKEPDIDIRVSTTASTPDRGEGVGNLLSRLKGVSLDAPKELAKEAPKVSDKLMAAAPPPPAPEPVKEKPKMWERPVDEPQVAKVDKPWEKQPAPASEPKAEQPGVRIPPPPSFSDEPVKPVEQKPADKPKPKSGESGLDDLMKKLRSHK